MLLIVAMALMVGPGEPFGYAESRQTASRMRRLRSKLPGCGASASSMSTRTEVACARRSPRWRGSTSRFPVNEPPNVL
jgi:hypothetical protein